jgi:amino acid permease
MVFVASFSRQHNLEKLALETRQSTGTHKLLFVATFICYACVSTERFLVHGCFLASLQNAVTPVFLRYFIARNAHFYAEKNLYVF